MIVTIGVGVQDRPSAAPQDGVWVSDYKIVGSPDFNSAITALTTIVFAYAGTPAFFSIAAEMRDPAHYGRALVLCQSVVTAFYIVIGVVVYYFCGSYVSSPALGSAGPTLKIVSYAFALPGLLVSTLLFIHVSSPSPSPSTSPSALTTATDLSQIHLRPHPPGLQAPHRQHPHALGRLDRLHLRHRPRRLHHRQRHPRLQRPRLARRRPPRHPHVLPAHGRHVAVRQLELGQGAQVAVVDGHGGLVCVCRAFGDVPHDWGDVWLDCYDY